MPELQVTLCGHSTSIACSDEDEPRLRHLISLVENRAEGARAIVGDSDRWRQLLFAAIFLADELDNAAPDAEAKPVNDDAQRVIALTQRIAASINKIEASFAQPLEQSRANA